MGRILDFEIRGSRAHVPNCSRFVAVMLHRDVPNVPRRQNIASMLALNRSMLLRAIGLLVLVIALIALSVAFETTAPPRGPHPYPMIRGGGLFLVVVGASLVAGAIFCKLLWHVLGAGAALASVALAFRAETLGATLGAPTNGQIGAVVLSILGEIVIIFLLPQLFPLRDDRTLPLAILLVVGFHFIFMAPAFGPLIVVLSVLTIANAGFGLWVRPSLHWHVTWAVDGFIKMGVGAVMLNLPALGT